MCAIVGSFDKAKLVELIKLNTYRGSHSWSLSEYDLKSGNVDTKRGLGDFDESALDSLTEGNYYIAHTQAPTTDAKSDDNIHPSKYEDSLLWHNGIIKDYFVTKMQDGLNRPHQPWDTALLNEWVSKGMALDDVDGTFSCLRYRKGQLTLFRNEISPMFMDEDWNLSSTKFEGSKPTKPGVKLWMDFEFKKLEEIKAFKTKENPYFFG